MSVKVKMHGIRDSKDRALVAVVTESLKDAPKDCPIGLAHFRMDQFGYSHTATQRGNGIVWQEVLCWVLLQLQQKLQQEHPCAES